jgi:hypothetical protein
MLSLTVNTMKVATEGAGLSLSTVETQFQSQLTPREVRRGRSATRTGYFEHLRLSPANRYTTTDQVAQYHFLDLKF